MFFFNSWSKIHNSLVLYSRITLSTPFPLTLILEKTSRLIHCPTLWMFLIVHSWSESHQTFLARIPHRCTTLVKVVTDRSPSVKGKFSFCVTCEMLWYYNGYILFANNLSPCSFFIYSWILLESQDFQLPVPVMLNPRSIIVTVAKDLRRITYCKLSLNKIRNLTADMVQICI